MHHENEIARRMRERERKRDNYSKFIAEMGEVSKALGK